MSPSASYTQIRQLKQGLVVLMVAWTAILAVSLAWNLHRQSHTTQAELRAQVEAIHAMNMEYRNWIIHNGGVYVPVTDKVQPSPWLSHLPERDITTADGKDLTLLNSSYALRLVQEMMAAGGGKVRMHISSLRPINPANTADAWERKALESFAQGGKESASVDVMDGMTYFRYMKPMVTDDSCMKCHAKYGDKLGDIRGGVSVSLPIDQVLLAARGEQQSLVWGHGLIWLIGIVGLVLGGRHQQQAALAVEKSEAQVTLLTNSIAHAIYGTDLNGCCTFANDACLEMLGYNAQAEILGKDMHALIHHTTREGTPCPKAYCEIAQALADGRSISGEGELFWRRDGTFFPVAYWAYPVMLQGRIEGSVVTFLDMTEQIEVKDALKKSQALLDSMIENIPAMVFLKRAEDLRFELFNLAGEKLLGYSRESLIGKNDYDLFPKAQADDFVKSDRAVLESRRMLEIPEEPVKTADGAEKWLHTYKIALVDEHNRPSHLLGISLDISDRKRAEDQLRESESKLAEAQRMAHLGHWDLDLETGRLTWSDEVYRIFECTPQTFAGTYEAFLEVIHPEDRAAVDQAYQASLSSRTPYQSEHRLLLPDGRIKYLLEKCETLFDVDGQPVRSTGTVQDVSTLKQAERALREHQKSLELTLEGTIHTVTMAVELRDPYTAGHQRRVAELACAIATKMGLDEDRVHGVRLGAMIHDIGKIGIPAEILSKPSQLTPVEMQIVREHAQMGYNILKDVQFPWPVAEIAYQHHERVDGSGYPSGLKGEAILLEARIVAVADVVESMASHRPYRPALGVDVAIEEIAHGRGTLYDATVVDACTKVLADGFSFE